MRPVARQDFSWLISVRSLVEMSALQAEPKPAPSPESVIVVAPLFRVQQGLRIGFRAERPSKPRKPISKAARMLALGYRYMKAVEDGEFEDFATLARKLKVSRAWISMCVELVFLAPRIQEAILFDSHGIPSIQHLVLVARRQNWESMMPFDW